MSIRSVSSSTRSTMERSLGTRAILCIYDWCCATWAPAHGCSLASRISVRSITARDISLHPILKKIHSIATCSEAWITPKESRKPIPVDRLISTDDIGSNGVSARVSHFYLANGSSPPGRRHTFGNVSNPRERIKPRARGQLCKRSLEDPQPGPRCTAVACNRQATLEQQFP